ncbi:hypothetical protein ACX0G9_08550 [Flavitalea flava]
MQRNYRVRLYFLTFSILYGTLLHGQFNIVPVQTGGLYLKAQLWNVSISNTSVSAVEATIHIEMKDIQTHQTVLSAISAPFHVPQGVKMVQMQALEPIIYTYGSGTVVDRSSNGMLPLGKFQVCYQLIWTYGENQTAAADDCEEIEVEPLSPPLLTMPDNDSVVIRSNPDFTWMPPAPISMFSDLNYDLLISPLYDGQSISDAITKNLPLQQAQGLRQPFFTFPIQGPQLEEGKKYVWQVIAKDRQQYGAKSEIWSFRMPDKKTTIPGNNLVYLLMDGKGNGREIIEPEFLHIKFISEIAAHEVSLILKDEKGIVQYKTKLIIRQGDNYLHIPLNRKFQSKNTYTAIIQSPDGRMNSLSFTIK